MKASKLLALLLALALCAGLAVPVLAAPDQNATHEDFDDLMVGNPYTPDPNDHLWEWAWATIDDGIRRGLFIGYTPYKDADGKTITNFGPGDMVTEAVGLTLCARMMVDKDQRETILKDRLDQMRELIPGTEKDPDDPNAPNMWFRKEAAACLELGVISPEELVALRDANRLGKAMTKADFAVYLIRAMGLEDFAKGLDASELPFTDAAKISREYRPYVKLLHTYGVLTGDQNGNFNPNQGMNRAVCATMLSRAIEAIQEGREVAVELPRYTTYPFLAGTIKEVTMSADGVRMMTLSDLAGEKNVIIPANALLYQNNMPAKTTDLKPGSYAKVQLNSNSDAVMVRLTPAGQLSTITGKCSAVDEEHVVVDGVSYAIDRFTQLSAGGKTGDREILDKSAGYTDAELTVNTRKAVLAMTLTGGTRLVDGILSNVTTNTQVTPNKTTITVTSFGGLPTIYNLTDKVDLTAKGKTLESLRGYEGKHVTLRVADENYADLKSVDVDPDGQYIQGVLRTVITSTKPNYVEITRTGDTRKTRCEVDEDCVITNEGKPAVLRGLPVETFATAKLEGAVITELSVWSGLDQISGVLSSVSYSDSTAQLVVTKEDNTTAEFALTLDDALKNIVILVDDKDGDITKLRSGDNVTITLRYNNITQIDVTPREADVTGILDSITFKAGAATILAVRLSDGTLKEFTASENITVTRDDKPALLTDVKAGAQVSMVTSDTRVLSLQFSGTAVSTTQVEGKIIGRDITERILTVLPVGEDAVPVKVRVPSGIETIVPIEGGSALTISRLEVGSSVLFFGSYDAEGVFTVKSGIRK